MGNARETFSRVFVYPRSTASDVESTVFSHQKDPEAYASLIRGTIDCIKLTKEAEKFAEVTWRCHAGQK